MASALGQYACPPVCPPACPLPCPPPCPPACPPQPSCVPVKAAGAGVGMLVGASIIGFMTVWVFFWVLFYSFNPPFCRRVERGEDKACDGAPPCPARVFVTSLVAALIVVAIVWIFRACTAC